MSDLGLAYQEYDFYEELFEKPKRIKRKKEPVKKFQLNLRRIQARGPNQQLAYDYFEQEDHLVLHGVAGTGKTYIALYLALKRLFERDCNQEKVVIVRSVVPTREMGFLPGSEKEKMKAYEAPYQAMCNELFGRGDAYQILKSKGMMQFMTSSFVRGLTFDNTIILVDECQSMTYHELDTIITRVGESSKIVFCGDTKQDDLEISRNRADVSGLCEFLRVLNRVDSFDCISFTPDDIVRSGLVKEYILAKELLVA